MRHFLLVDDEVHILHALQRMVRHIFRGQELRIEIHTEPGEALARIRETMFDVVVSDYRMPGMNGVDFLEMVKAAQPDAVRLLLTASTEFDTAMNAVNRAEVFRYLAKPWHLEQLKAVLEQACERRDLLRLERGELTPQELEERRLEALEPGITKVNWGPDGSVLLS